MRTAIQIVTLLAIAALLAPELKWAYPVAPQSCECPPQACVCEGHHHASGNKQVCTMANGDRCGVSAPDANLSSPLSAMAYMAIEHVWWLPTVQSRFDFQHAANSPLPAHTRIPDQPPRANV